jgi:hypothetical protein
MKSILKTTVLATSLVLALGACSEKDKNDNGGDGRIQVSAKMKSDELTEAAEQLVSPYTFMLADKVLDMAIEKDGTNTKAQFYKAFLKRAMVFKGIAKRVAPMMAKNPQQKLEYDRTVKDFPESPLKKFLLDGKEDIHSYSQLQSVLSDYSQALNDFRKFLKLNQNAELTLNLNPYVFEKEINQELVNSCTWTGENGSYDVHCDHVTVAQKKINVADMIALRQMTSGEMLYFSIYTAYDMSTIEQALSSGQLTNATPQQTLAYYKSLPSVAKLRQNHTLNLIPEIGSDFSAALKWAIQYQDRVCPKGEGQSNQRKGFLFKNGVCIKSGTEVDKGLALLDQAMSGIFTNDIKEKDQTVDQIRVNLVGFVTAPPTDLKNVLPTELDASGKATEWTDKTMGGLFPDGDIHKLNRNK